MDRSGGERGSVTVLAAALLFAGVPLLVLVLGLGDIGLSRVAAAGDAAAAAATGSCSRAAATAQAAGAALVSCRVVPADDSVQVTVAVSVPGWLARLGAREVRARASRRIHGTRRGRQRRPRTSPLT
jgi:hypothetical protein